jgi:CMP-N-acetylneuraminic acid synthetase
MKKKIIKYLAIIPCRKNSKRIKNKNLKKINDKSLVEITLNQAQKVKQIESIIISTDSTKILKIIKDHKKIIKFKRKKRLSKDNSTTESVILDVIQEYEKKKDREIKNIILLQATSPLRRYSDISNAIKTYEEGNYDSLFSAHYEKLFLWKKKKNFFFHQPLGGLDGYQR